MGASLVISLCCVLCRLLPRELLQGFWCRHDRRDVPWVCDSLPLRSWGLLRVLLLRSIAWFATLARGFLFASDSSIFFDPGSACLGLFANGVLCLYAQDPVAQCLICRCALHFWCLCFDSSCSRLDRVSDFVSLEFSTRFQCFTVPCLVESETQLHM